MVDTLGPAIPTSGEYHEVLDRLHIITCNLAEYVVDSQACHSNPTLKAMVTAAVDLLQHAYKIGGDAAWTRLDAEEAQIRTQVISEYLTTLAGTTIPK